MSRNACSNENGRFDEIMLTKLTDLTKLNWKTLENCGNFVKYGKYEISSKLSNSPTRYRRI